MRRVAARCRRVSPKGKRFGQLALVSGESRLGAGDRAEESDAHDSEGVLRHGPYTSRAMRFLSRFVDSNDREIRRIQPLVDEINELEAEIAALSDEAIRERFALIREEIHEPATPGEPTEEEGTHPDLARRRELAKARHKRTPP